jgi:DNA-binding transcriptional MerR regulator
MPVVVECIVSLDMKAATGRRPPTEPRAVKAPGSARAGETAPLAEPKLRMRDLVHESGLPRETIHFYIQQGLLPKPLKTGRNTALYPASHLERLRRIRHLQEGQFLPLKAIRAILDETAEERFTLEQEDLVRRVRATLVGWADAQQRPTVPVADFVPSRVTRDELRDLARAGLVHVHGSAASGTVTEDDAVILECWAQFKESGLGPDRGVSPSDFKIFDHAMEQLVAREARLAMRAYEGVAVEEVSKVVEQAAPIVGRLLSAMHRKRLRQFLLDAGGNHVPTAR